MDNDSDIDLNSNNSELNNIKIKIDQPDENNNIELNFDNSTLDNESNYDDYSFFNVNDENQLREENIINDEEINNIINKENSKKTFIDTKYYVDDFFNSSIVYKYSCALDILVTYLRGQKILYNESKNLYSFYLNCIMIPCILFTSVSTILSQTTINNSNIFNNYRDLIICIISALSTCLITCMNFLKLDAGSESFKIIAKQYEKIEKDITFSSGTILLFSHPCLEDTNYHKNSLIFNKLNNMNPYTNNLKKNLNKFLFHKEYYKKVNYEEYKLVDTLKNKIEEIKKKILEIDDTNKFPIPYNIQQRFLNIYSINIFTIIKKIDDFKSKLIMRLKNIHNKIVYYKTIIDDCSNEVNNEISKQKIIELYDVKYKIIEKILYLKTSFLIIDNIFQQEIKNDYIKKKYYLRFFFINTFGDFFPRCFICTLYPKNYVNPKDFNSTIYNILFEPFNNDFDD